MYQVINRVARATWAHTALSAGVVLAAAVVAAGWPATSQAQQQLTTELLIGDSVADPGNKYPEVDTAIKYFGNGDVLGARTLLEEAKKKSPALPPSDLLLAKMYLITSQIAAGRSRLENAVMENPTDPESYILLGEIDLAQGGTTEAEALFDKGLALTEQFNENPKRKRNFGIRSRWGRSQVFERRKNWTAMGSDLQALLKIDEHHAAARFKMGIALCRLGRFSEGKTFMDAAQKDDDKHTLPGTLVTMAWLYDQANKPSEAKQTFEAALRDDPKSMPPTVQYAQWLIKNGSYTDAERILAAARQAHPEAIDIYVLSGATALMSGKLKEAEENFITALGKRRAVWTLSTNSRCC